MIPFSSLYNMPRFNVINLDYNRFEKIINTMNSAPFFVINSVRTELNRLSFIKVITEDTDVLSHYPDRPLLIYRRELYRFLNENNILPNQALLFIPKMIYENKLNRFEGSSWARGMLVYAVTGVALVHGIETSMDTYGGLNYAKNSFWHSREAFQPEDFCGKHFSRVIITDKFSPPEFSLYRCAEDISIGLR